MIIKRNNNLDEDPKESVSLKDQLGFAASLGGGILGIKGLMKGREKIRDIHYNLYRKAGLLEKLPGNDRLINSLKDYAKDKGVRIYYDKNFDNSAYVGVNKLLRYLKKVFLDSAKQLKEKGLAKESNKMMKCYLSLLELLSEAVRNFSLSKKCEGIIGKDAVIMGFGADNLAILAHELGHAMLNRNILSRFSLWLSGGCLNVTDKLFDYIPSARSFYYDLKYKDYKRLLSSSAKVLALFGLLADGFRRGKNSVTTNEETKQIEVKRTSILKSMGVGSLFSLPVILNEAGASVRGLINLKKMGATEEEMNSATQLLASTLGTYICATALPMLLETGGHLVGTGYGHLRELYKMGKEERENQKQFTRVLTSISSAPKLEDLSDKLLENASKYKKPKIGTLIAGCSPFVASGALAGGLLNKGQGKKKVALGALKGAGITSAISGALAVGGHYHHKKVAREAKELLEKRLKDNENNKKKD